MIEKIKNILLDRFLDIRLKLVRNNNALFNFPEKIKTIKNVLIIKPSDSSLESHMHHFTSELYSIFGEVKVSTFERNSLRKSDKNWLGVPNEKYLKNFQDEEFDLVIDLNTKQDKICFYLCALSGAPMRMNLTSGKYDHLYNLHIRTNQSKSLPEQLENILNYLKTFRAA